MNKSIILVLLIVSLFLVGCAQTTDVSEEEILIDEVIIEGEGIEIINYEDDYDMQDELIDEDDFVDIGEMI